MDEFEESASEFEIASDEAPSSSEPSVREGSAIRSTLSTPAASTTSRKRRRSESKTSEQPSKGPRNDLSESKIQKDAARWAITFEPPRVEDIKTPPRKAARAKSVSRRKDYKQNPSTTRAKHLRPFYNDEYRLLLNDTIQDTASGMLEDDNADSVESSQIGTSIWTSQEKDLFFSALGRLGRDKIRSIAARIGTKSEIQVQEYILLLAEGVRERHNRSARVLQSIEVPAALEVSDECCVVLARAGDAISSRQEQASEKVDREKWGDSWLLTKESSRWIEKKIVQKGGENEIEEVLPAANLLNLDNWLKLSREVFMNPGSSHEEDNWTKICEPGETPAMRATAFEDFHSLTVNLMKRIISTVLFCTMSRIRATNPRGTKHAEIQEGDVEAAVQLLGLKQNSNDFWINCPRRCDLDIVNDGEEDEIEDDGNSEDNDTDGEASIQSDEENEDIAMTYPSIEANLRTTIRPSRSRSRSTSRRPRTPTPTQHPNSSPFKNISRGPSPSTNASISGETSENNDDSSSDGLHSPLPSESDIETDHTAALELAQDTYAETMDMHRSSKDEIQLWRMLHQTVPFEIEVPSVLDLRFPRSLPTDIEGRQWRDYMEYVRSWETLETPVSREAFKQNEARWARKGKRKPREMGKDEEEGSDCSGDREDEETMGERIGEVQEEAIEIVSDEEQERVQAFHHHNEDDVEQEQETFEDQDEVKNAGINSLHRHGERDMDEIPDYLIEGDFEIGIQENEDEVEDAEMKGMHSEVEQDGQGQETLEDQEIVDDQKNFDDQDTFDDQEREVEDIEILDNDPEQALDEAIYHTPEDGSEHLIEYDIEPDPSEPEDDIGSPGQDTYQYHQEDGEQENMDMEMALDDTPQKLEKVESPPPEPAGQQRSPSVESQPESPSMEWDFEAEFQKQMGN